MGDIWLAARTNNVIRVQFFLDQGVSPNVTRWSGVSPLHRAAEVNSCQTAQMLIKAGANVNARTAWGWFAPLHLACKNGHEQVAEVLLRAGAKWTILTKRLQSPYDLTVAAGLKIEALRIQALSRKVAEERRILHSKAPEDAVLAKTRKMSHAILRKQSQQKIPSFQQQQRKPSVVTLPNDSSSRHTNSRSARAGSLVSQVAANSEVQRGGAIGAQRTGSVLGKFSASGVVGLVAREGRQSHTAKLMAFADVPEDGGDE